MHQKVKLLSELKRHSIRRGRERRERERRFHMDDSFAGSLDRRNDVEVRQHGADDPDAFTYYKL